jgi:hypothetical protein
MDLDALCANSGRFCPAWHMVEPGDEPAALALGRPVVDACPEPLPDETGARWFAATLIVGVGADDDGYPASGDDAGAVRVGTGTGVLLATRQRLAAVVTDGDLLGAAPGEAQWLVLSCDLADVVAVEPETKRGLVHTSTRAVTIEVDGSSWGAIGVAVAGELQRAPGDIGAPVQRSDATALIALLTAERS